MTTQIYKHLPAPRAERLLDTITKLGMAMRDGMVPNTMFIDAKDTFNRAVDQSAEAFLQTGPHNTVPTHAQSDWWLAAYSANAFVSGTHTLPTILARATKAGLTEYAAFLTDLLALRTLLEAAKPLVKKRGELPKVRTPAQIADEADRMTCQCCARGIFAATGTIAHHGYERPGTGWQTASCMGAKELPFEVSRDALGRLIDALRLSLAGMKKTRAAVLAERAPVMHTYTDYTSGRREEKTLRFTRKDFAEVFAARSDLRLGFDEFKRRDLAGRDHQIDSQKRYLKECQTRFDGWKQTHKREGDVWVAL